MKNVRYLATLLFWATLFNCSEDDNPVGSEDKNFIYPLKIGNKWEYSRQFSSFNFRRDPDADSTALIPQDTTISSHSLVEIFKQERLPNSIKAFILHETLTEAGSSSFEDDAYYNNQEDGLYFYAYRGPGWVIPKSVSHGKIFFKDRHFGTIRDITSFIEKAIPNRYGSSDSLIYENPPLKSLPYPMAIGVQWVYRQAGNPWRIDKKVLGKENVSVPAGEFNCYKIQWLIDIRNDGTWDEDIEFFDYVGSQGLIQRSILYKDLIWTSSDSPYGMGKFDSKDESRLISVHLE